MQRLGSHHQRRAHRVEGKFLKVVAGLLGEDLIDHESLVAPPGCFELAGWAQPQFRVAMHGEPGLEPGDLSAASADSSRTAGAGTRAGAWAPLFRSQRGAWGPGRRANQSGHGRACCVYTHPRSSIFDYSLFGTPQLSISAHFLQGQVRSASRGASAATPPLCVRAVRVLNCAPRVRQLTSSRQSELSAPHASSLF